MTADFIAQRALAVDSVPRGHATTTPIHTVRTSNGLPAHQVPREGGNGRDSIHNVQHRQRTQTEQRKGSSL